MASPVKWNFDITKGQRWSPAGIAWLIAQAAKVPAKPAKSK